MTNLQELRNSLHDLEPIWKEARERTENAIWEDIKKIKRYKPDGYMVGHSEGKWIKFKDVRDLLRGIKK